MPPTPVPNLRRAEWLDRALRSSRAWVADKLHRRNRRRTAKQAAVWIAGVLAVAVFKVAIDMIVIRIGWTAPPGRSGERLGAERIEK